jgi:hypothetical protein
MQENLLSKLFGDLDGQVLNGAEEQVRDGFSRFGLVEVTCQSSLFFLFHYLAMVLCVQYTT